jgi:hypothetical protein
MGSRNIKLKNKRVLQGSRRTVLRYATRAAPCRVYGGRSGPSTFLLVLLLTALSVSDSMCILGWRGE